MAIVANTSGTRARTAVHGWADVAVELLEGAEDTAPTSDVSSLLLRSAAQYTYDHGWRRGAFPLNPGGEAGILGAIHLAGLPFGWPFAEHLARVRAAALVLWRWLEFKGSQFDNPLATIQAWDLAPERWEGAVYDALLNAADGKPRCHSQIYLADAEGYVCLGGAKRPGGQCWNCEQQQRRERIEMAVAEIKSNPKALAAACRIALDR